MRRFTIPEGIDPHLNLKDKPFSSLSSKGITSSLGDTYGSLDSDTYGSLDEPVTPPSVDSNKSKFYLKADKNSDNSNKEPEKHKSRGKYGLFSNPYRQSKQPPAIPPKEVVKKDPIPQPPPSPIIKLEDFVMPEIPHIEAKDIEECEYTPIKTHFKEDTYTASKNDFKVITEAFSIEDLKNAKEDLEALIKRIL